MRTEMRNEKKNIERIVRFMGVYGLDVGYGFKMKMYNVSIGCGSRISVEDIERD